MKLSSLVSFALASQAFAQQNAQNATSFALTYGNPLLAFQKLADLFTASNNTNVLVNGRSLSNAGSTTVVKPNADTLYSVAVFDLSRTDLSFSIPRISPGSYALFSFYDPFGDNYANIGTGLFNQSGNYILQGRGNTSQPIGVFPRTSNASNTSVVADIYSPTTYGIFLARWLINATNLNAANGYQDQLTLRSVNRPESGSIPSLTSLRTSNISSARPAEQVLQLLAKYAPYNMPETAAATTQVNGQLRAAGISNGTYTAPSGIDLEAANSSAKAAAVAAAVKNTVSLNNGWSVPQTAASGNFNNGTNYSFREAIASAGYLMLQAPTAVYPSWTNTTSDALGGALTLGRGESYLYTFSRKPPLNIPGFWSITAYGPDSYLVPNSLNRFQLGDRSNLTYPDGTLVYGSNTTSADRPFQILLQAADNPPPQNWTSNWLPGPAGGGNMSALLRFYSAQQDLLNGSYRYPVVTRQAAITNGTTGSGSGSSSSTMVSPSSTTSRATSTASAAPSSSSTSSGGEGVSWASRAMSILALCVALVL